VLFLAVSGEELGLWGSAWFAENPTWPMPQIVANINTDMIGRGGPDAELGQVMLTPSYKHGQFSSMGRTAARAAEVVGLELVADDKFFARSDHYNFVKRGVPAVFLCCAGEHEDYHQVTDHADRLDGEQMERTARLAYWIGRATADADERPAVIGRHNGWLGEPRSRR
jgi:Zn-dependent M28 family amino/carboxypeptidase